jgi:hypothetical protein
MSEEKFHDGLFHLVRFRLLLSKLENKVPESVLCTKSCFNRLQKVYGVQSRLSSNLFDTDKPSSDRYFKASLKTLKAMDTILNQFEKSIGEN